MKVISTRWVLVLWKPTLCSKVIWTQEAPFEGVPRLTMGWLPRDASFFGIVRERVLLGEYAGGCRGVCTYVHHLLVGQIGYSEARRTVAAFTDS